MRRALPPHPRETATADCLVYLTHRAAVAKDRQLRVDLFLELSDHRPIRQLVKSFETHVDRSSKLKLAVKLAHEGRICILAD